MRLLLKNGHVISGSGRRAADILVDAGKILAVSPDLQDAEAKAVDCSGMLLFPGFIDPHTHFDLEVAGTVSADNFFTGTRAALKGGTTTIIDFATPNKGESLSHGLARWEKKSAGQCACDYSFHMTIDDWSQDISREIGEIVQRGIPSFKMYMTYPAMMIGETQMYHALKRLKEAGGIAGIHCENHGIIAALTEEYRSAGRLSPASHPRTRPNALEAEAVSHLLRIAQVADVPVIIVHLSTREALEEVRAARRRGQTVYVETCPQYLLLDQRVYDAGDFSAAARYVCAPPLRGLADQAALWQGLGRGDIQTVATDHCSFTLDQKALGREDFTKIPGGLPGVETRGILLYSAGVASGRISLGDMCRVLCENPAKLYGCWPRKGIITPGSDADIVVLDPGRRTVISRKTQLQNVDYNPYEGMELAGGIAQVYLRGTLAVENGKVLAGSMGQFIPRGKYAL